MGSAVLITGWWVTNRNMAAALLYRDRAAAYSRALNYDFFPGPLLVERDGSSYPPFSSGRDRSCGRLQEHAQPGSTGYRWPRLPSVHLGGSRPHWCLKIVLHLTWPLWRLAFYFAAIFETVLLLLPCTVTVNCSCYFTNQYKCVLLYSVNYNIFANTVCSND